MAREIISRFRMTGTVVAKTPLHVGGHGEDVDTDLPLARDGRGELYVPGTSIAGALRRWCELAFDHPRGDYDEGRQPTEQIWGYQDRRPDKEKESKASFIVIDDAVIENPESVLVEVRDGVGIDRGRGAAAENIKYDRAILPRGTKLKFALSAEVKDAEHRLAVLAMLSALKEAMESGRVRLGASKTRGLGRIRLEDGKLVEEKFNDRQGILDLLKNGGKAVADVDQARQKHPAQAMPRIEISINWQPAGPLMVKAGFDGIAVDMLPLVSGREGGLSLVLPGSSVKGAMRAQAERIVRTLLDRDLTGEFLRDLELPLIDDLFGLRGLSEDDKKRRSDEPDEGPLQGLSALAVDDCFGTHAVSHRHWQAVEAAENDDQLRTALSAAGLEPWSAGYHVAIDRWTGAAAESMLYTVLEPHRAEWEPLELEVDLGRLRDTERLPAVALLLLVVTVHASGSRSRGWRIDFSPIWTLRRHYLWMF